MVAGASEVRLPDRGGNPAAVARGDCLRVAVDVLPSGKLGWEFLAVAIDGEVSVAGVKDVFRGYRYFQRLVFQE